MSRKTQPVGPAGYTRRAIVLVLCVVTPAAVLSTSYLWLALEHGTPWLWPVVVHESGRYTFGQAVLYTSHFLREVPTILAYVLFLLGVSGGVARGDVERGERGRGAPEGREGEPPEAPVRRRGRSRGRHRRSLAALAVAAAILLVATAFFATARSNGWNSALLDLLQYRTRDDLVGYGTHWRYHWLSTAWFGVAAAVAPTVVRHLTGGTDLRVHRGWMSGGWVYFLALTLLFGLSPDVFTDVRYAGHQAREILTHGPTTLLGGIGIVLAAAGRTGLSTGGAGPPEGDPTRSRVRIWPAAAALVAVILIPLHLSAVSLSGDIMEQGQSELGLSAMVAAHYFEHTLDYLLTALLLMGGLARARA